jgi:hypothetical protein
VNVLRIVALLLRLYGGQVECQPVQPPICTLFVGPALAIDVIETPGGEIEILRWDPGAYVIGD